MGAINDAVEKPHIVTLAEGSGSPMPMPMPTLTLIFKALAAYRRKAVTFAIAIINFTARVVILRSGYSSGYSTMAGGLFLWNGQAIVFSPGGEGREPERS